MMAPWSCGACTYSRRSGAAASRGQCSPARIVLSTSELQQAALAFYRGAGYEALGEELATAATNKTVGGGIRRFHFAKRL